MVFSKSFGYAVRSVLYVAAHDYRPFVQAEEIAHELALPRHFVSKILIKLVKAGVLSSLKGKAGGFALTPGTGKVTLMEIFRLTDGEEVFQRCALRLQGCNGSHPCPMHNRIVAVRQRIKALLTTTTVNDLLTGDKTTILKSMVTAA